MKTYRIVGMAFIVILLGFTASVLLQITPPVTTEGKEITYTNSNVVPPEKVFIDMDNGILYIIKNTTISGWYLMAKYKEKDSPPSITFSNKTLSINFDNGILKLYVNRLNVLDFSLINGNSKVILYNITCSLKGHMINGEMDLILLNSNLMINTNLMNGKITVSAYNVKMNGNITVLNGDIKADIYTNHGGEINYIVGNGDAEVLAINFNVEKYISDSGVNGRVYREGENLNLNLKVSNGEITLLVVGL